MNRQPCTVERSLRSSRRFVRAFALGLVFGLAFAGSVQAQDEGEEVDAFEEYDRQVGDTKTRKTLLRLPWVGRPVCDARRRGRGRDPGAAMARCSSSKSDRS